MREIGIDDVDDLATGAAILGAGGGGDPWVATLMLRSAIERHGPVQVVEAADLPPDDLVLPVAIAGAPTAVVEKLPGIEDAQVVRDLITRHTGRPSVAVMPLEIGGINSLYPLVAAAELGLPCVDADGMCRAFPQLEMTLFNLAGLSLSPMALSDPSGGSALIDTPDNVTGERMLRAALGATGMVAVVGLYPQSARQCHEHASLGSLTYCREVGRLARAVAGGAPGRRDALLARTGGSVVFSGRVVDVVRRTTEGWARGTATLETLGDPVQLMRVDFQNENLVALLDGVPMATVPDIITLLDAETGAAVTTEAIAYGQRLDVLVLPVHPRWRSPEGLALTGPRAFGYDLDHVAGAWSA